MDLIQNFTTPVPWDGPGSRLKPEDLALFSTTSTSGGLEVKNKNKPSVVKSPTKKKVIDHFLEDDEEELGVTDSASVLTREEQTALIEQLRGLLSSGAKAATTTLPNAVSSSNTTNNFNFSFSNEEQQQYQPNQYDVPSFSTSTPPFHLNSEALSFDTESNSLDFKHEDANKVTFSFATPIKAVKAKPAKAKAVKAKAVKVKPAKPAKFKAVKATKKKTKAKFSDEDEDESDDEPVIKKPASFVDALSSAYDVLDYSKAHEYEIERETSLIPFLAEIKFREVTSKNSTLRASAAGAIVDMLNSITETILEQFAFCHADRTDDYKMTNMGALKATVKSVIPGLLGGRVSAMNSIMQDYTLRDMYALRITAFMANKTDFEITKQMKSALGGVVAFLCSELLNSAYIVSKDLKDDFISAAHLRIAVRTDYELNLLFAKGLIARGADWKKELDGDERVPEFASDDDEDEAKENEAYENRQFRFHVQADPSDEEEELIGVLKTKARQTNQVPESVDPNYQHFGTPKDDVFSFNSGFASKTEEKEMIRDEDKDEDEDDDYNDVEDEGDGFDDNEDENDEDEDD
eukprot:TRINITY_DN544_c0_g1_i1.p1 TRINITY_DN544_c0_g1~~TRINITY_DN544_c0_g1_i1.p1  ORF type:complete len:577 (+),score=177.90 TRINITY_DN544_c0_g1_i1:39-1769(+)